MTKDAHFLPTDLQADLRTTRTEMRALRRDLESLEVELVRSRASIDASLKQIARVLDRIVAPVVILVVIMVAAKAGLIRLPLGP